MKKHIIRLVVVLILAVGIGFGVYMVVNKTTPFKLNAYACTQSEEIENLEQNLGEISGKVDDVFLVNSLIFSAYKTDLNAYINTLNSYNFSKEEGEKIKSKYSSFAQKIDGVNSSITNLEEYLSLSDQERDESTLDGYKSKLNQKLATCLTEFYGLNNCLSTFVEEKIFGGKSYDATFILLSTRDLVFNTYMKIETKVSSGTDFVKKLNKKIEAYLANDEIPTTDTLKLAVEINKFSKTKQAEEFAKHLKATSVDSDFKIVIEYLSNGVYYEKV